MINISKFDKFVKTLTNLSKIWQVSQTLIHLSNFHKFVKLWQICQTLTNLANFDKFGKLWQICQILTNLSKFEKIVKFWEIRQTLTNLSNFDKFVKFYIDLYKIYVNLYQSISSYIDWYKSAWTDITFIYFLRRLI